MKKLLLIFCLTSLTYFAKSQPPYYNYVNEPNIAGSTYYSCLATSSGYVFAGSANNLIFDSHLFFTRTTTTGTIQQMRTFTASGYNNFSCAIQTTDGKFAYFGTEISNVNFVGSLVLLKLDIVGNYLITKTYADPNYSFTARKMIQDAQGNYYMIANASNNTTFQNSMCLIVTDPSGNITGQKFFNPGFDLSAMDIVPAGNGVLLTGYAEGASIETIVLIKLNSSLNIDWSKWFSDSAVKYFHYDIKEKSTGNFILCGRYDDGVNPFSTLIFEIDNNGNQVWAKQYPSLNSTYNHAYSVALTSSGAAVVGGGIDTSPGLGPILALSVNAANGNLNWAKQISTGAPRELIYIIACGVRGSDGAILKVDALFDNCVDQPYLVSEASVTLTVSSINPVATNSSLVAGNWSATPATFTTLGDACFGVGLEEENMVIGFSTYPNPVTDELYIEGKIVGAEIKIFDSIGKMVFHSFGESDSMQKIHVANLSCGIYNLHILTEKGVHSAKFVKVD
jgi:hypothetical protein